MLVPMLLLLTGPATITIDATHQKPISPYIYGANFPDWAHISVPFTLARNGGNRTTAYNWETNASNAGNDYRFQNDGYIDESNEAGRPYRRFMEDAQNHGAAVLLTVPTAGYVSADKKGDGDVRKTPDYLRTRFIKSYAKKNRPFTYPPDTKDNAVYQDEMVWWLEKIKSNKTPLWFSLDNEPDIWASTHAEIVPKNPGFAGIFANNVEFAEAIKDVAPNTLIFGPANYGWQGFRHFQDAKDGNGRDFLDFYLSGMHQMQTKFGHRLLDVLDIHWYPEAQGGGTRITTDNPADMAKTADARIQAPRSLWDPTYVEDSWITKSIGGKPIALIPSIQAQIAKNYPGTKFAITEYNYGGANDISGALAQADALGAFGRYGLFAASNWGIGPKDQAELDGFEAFLDPKHRFGDRGLAVAGVDPSAASVYAALDSKSKGHMTLVIINKQPSDQPFELRLNGFHAHTVSARALTASDLANFQPQSASLMSGKLTLTAPGRSIVCVDVK